MKIRNWWWGTITWSLSPNTTECDVNCHKKCEKLTANLCGVNQKLIVEALSSVRRGSIHLLINSTGNTIGPVLCRKWIEWKLNTLWWEESLWYCWTWHVSRIQNKNSPLLPQILCLAVSLWRHLDVSKMFINILGITLLYDSPSFTRINMISFVGGGAIIKETFR